VITPSSVESAYCENKVEYARELQKRIVPVLRTGTVRAHASSAGDRQTSCYCATARY
jgi:hypothetical protein